MTTILVVGNRRTSGGGSRVEREGTAALANFAHQRDMVVITARTRGLVRRSPKPTHILYLSETAPPVLSSYGSISIRLGLNLKTFFPRGFHESLRAAAARRLLALADIRVVPNEFSRLAFEGHGFTIDGVAPLGIASTFTPLGPASSGRYAVCFSGLGWQRGTDLILPATHTLLASGLVDEVRVVGIPPHDLGEAALRAGITFLGNVADTELAELYRGARFALLLSRLDSFGFPFLEAAACGTPILGLYNGSLLEYGVLGAYTDDGLAGIVQAARKCCWLRDSESAQLAQVATSLRQHYSWEKFATRLLEIVESSTL